MYREKGAGAFDSGWRFLAGHESMEYMAAFADHALHDLDAITKLDPEIVPLLDAPVGWAFGRVGGAGPLVEIEEDDLDQD